LPENSTHYGIQAAPESLFAPRRGRQDAFRALLERQQQAEQAKEAPAQAPDYDRDWGMDGP